MPDDTWTTGYAAQTLPTGPSMIAGPLDGLIYSLGGIAPPGGSTRRSEVYAYDHAANTWTAKASMPAARSLSVTAVASGKVWVLGGQNATGVAQSTVYEYTPGTNAWATKTAGPTAHQGAAGAAVGALIYVAYTSTTSPMDAYDTIADTWTGKAAIGFTRTASSASVLGAYMYVIKATNDRYDPAANTWATRANSGMSTVSGCVGMDALGTLFLNGLTSGGLSLVKTYNPATDTWTTRTVIPTARTNQTGGQLAALVDNIYVYVIGGASGGPNERYQAGADPRWYVGTVALARS